MALRDLKKTVIHNIHTTWNFLEHFSDLIKDMLEPTCYKRLFLVHLAHTIFKEADFYNKWALVEIPPRYTLFQLRSL